MNLSIAERVLLFASFAILCVVLFDVGFGEVSLHQHVANASYIAFGLIYLIAEFSNCLVAKINWSLKLRRLFFYLIGFISFLCAILNFFQIWQETINIYRITVIFTLFLSVFTVSQQVYSLKQTLLHPALVFVLSFSLLVIMGAILLSLPKASIGDVHLIDALFMSTSAVCVTGLSVFDVGYEFTEFGQWVILGLIQIGALGILTFTNLFGLLFMGKGSLQNQLNLQDVISSDNLNNAKSDLVKIITFTVFIELIGFLLIFTYIPQFGSLDERLFFSLFHSISAFCNAGFSTLSNGLYQEGFSHNYSLHLIIAALIIVGGIGYNVFINIYYYFKRWLKIKFYHLTGNKRKKNATPQPSITLNTRIVFYTTVIFLVSGTLLYYIIEYNNTLSSHQGMGKWVEAFFGSVTPRTAGFNTVDIGALSQPMILIYLFFMWVGASPGSTGGGVKTTTIALATMTIFQFVTGRTRLDIAWKHVSSKVLLRVSVIIYLSLIVIGGGVFFITWFDPQIDPKKAVFEVFSAYSTVGLSMGITAQLSSASKLVLIFIMFVGRVSLFTILMGVIQQFYKPTHKPYSYPKEDVPIN